MVLLSVFSHRFLPVARKIRSPQHTVLGSFMRKPQHTAPTQPQHTAPAQPQHTAPTQPQHTAPTQPQHTAPIQPQHTASIPRSRHTATAPQTRPNTHPHYEVFTPCPDHLRPRSTLISRNWETLLREYPDDGFVRDIVGIATYGARLGYSGPFQVIRSKNHSSALRIPNDIRTNLRDEIEAGRVKIVKSLPLAYVSSPIGAVQKKSNGEFTGWRRIHDLSYPTGSSVNDGIPRHFGSLKYQTLDDAIILIAKHGRGTTLHKRDLKDAFRKIPVSPYDYWLLLFEWEGEWFVDIFLPFGLSTAPFLFNMFAEGLHWILEHQFHQSIVHYLDDFLLVGGNDTTLFGRICNYLGLEEKPSKSIDGTVVDFTGIELDSDRMEARLPRDKHSRALSAVQEILHRGSANFLTLRSLIGFLSFCTRVIPLGRPFLRNLFNFLYTCAANPRSNRRLSAPATRDLKWWSTFLKNWPGKRLIRQSRHEIHVYTDASGTKGIGGWWGPHAFSSRMPRRHRAKHINWKEAYAILFALAKWGDSWSGYRITFMCDNTAIVDAINKTSIRGDAINPLQLILLTAALHDIEVNACWLPTKDNWIADALSRFNLKRLANFKLDLLFNLPRRESGTPMSTLRRRLHNYFGTDSPQLQEPLTMPLGEPMNDSPSTTDIPPFQSRSPPLLTGSQKFSRKTRRKLSKPTLPRYEVNMSTSECPLSSSTTSESNEYSMGPFAYMDQNPSGNEQRSPNQSCSEWSPLSIATRTTTSTFSQLSLPPLQPSSALLNSPGMHGTTPPLRCHISHADQSNSHPPASSCTSPNPKPTSLGKAKLSQSLHHQMRRAPLRPSSLFSETTLAHPTTLSSAASPAHSTSSGCQTRSKARSLTQASTQPITPVIHYEGEPRIPLSQLVSPATTSKKWEDGSPTPSTAISLRNPRNTCVSQRTEDCTWPPQLGELPSNLLRSQVPRTVSSDNRVDTGPSSEDARHPSWPFTLGYGFPILLYLLLVLIERN